MLVSLPEVKLYYPCENWSRQEDKHSDMVMHHRLAGQANLN